MKPPNPKFDHRALRLLETLTTKTLPTFKQIHSQFIASGLALHTYPLSRLVVFSPSSSYSLSLLLHSQSPHPPSTFLFNTLISSLSNLTHIALSLYSAHLLHSPAKPNAHTYPSLLKACGTHQWIPHGLALHAHILKFDFFRDPFVLSALLNFYCRQGKVGVARYLFDEIQEPDLPTWNSILAAYSRCGPVVETLVLFQRMLVSCLVRPNEITLVAVVSACGDLGALGQGVWAHEYIIRKGLLINCFVGTALLEMYAKCGRLDLAEQVFDGTARRDTMCYNAMIRGFATHGCGHRAIELFCRMEIEGVRVDDVTMVVVLSACAHSGLVDEGRRYFDRMQKDYGIEPKNEHYGCLVDLLGRGGRLKEAERVIAEMPMLPNALLYRSLLGACKVHGDLEMGKRLVSQLLQLEPGHGGNYVLQSNMYANTMQWNEVGKVRKIMRDKGISKTPGLSLV